MQSQKPRFIPTYNSQTGLKLVVHSLAARINLNICSRFCFVGVLTYIDHAHWPLHPRQFSLLNRLFFLLLLSIRYLLLFDTSRSRGSRLILPNIYRHLDVFNFNHIFKFFVSFWRTYRQRLLLERICASGSFSALT